MTFIPYHDKIEVKPFKKEGPFATASEQYEEMGEVIAVGSGVTGEDDPKVGDILFFLPHGCWTTAEYEGVKHFLVPNTGEFILGKITK